MKPEEVFALFVLALMISAFIGFLVHASFRRIETKTINERRFEKVSAVMQESVKAAEKKVEENSDPVHILFEVSNSELRQSLIAKYGGFETLLAKTKHDIIHTDDYGVLFRVFVPRLSRHFYYVKVINGTMEDDGTFREYYKEVPPDMDTAKEAVAWTYGIHPDDYNIAIRT